jgi:hypothetical protein
MKEEALFKKLVPDLIREARKKLLDFGARAFDLHGPG